MSLALLRCGGLGGALRSLSSLGASTSGAWSQLLQQHEPQQQPQQPQARGYAKAAAKGGAKGKSSSKQKGGKDAKKGPSKPRKIRSAGSFNAQDPFNARVLAMLLPPPGEPARLALPAEEQAAAAARAKEYSRLKMEEHKRWQGGVMRAIRLRDAALAALPADLRAAAQQEDLEPLPLSRNFYYDHPPKAYRD
jgi:hypothetical protein